MKRHAPPKVYCNWRITTGASASPLNPISINISYLWDYYEKLKAGGKVIYLGEDKKLRHILWEAEGSFNGKFSWELSTRQSAQKRSSVILDDRIRYFIVWQLGNIAKLRRTAREPIHFSKKADLDPEKELS